MDLLNNDRREETSWGFFFFHLVETEWLSDVSSVTHWHHHPLARPLRIWADWCSGSFISKAALLLFNPSFHPNLNSPLRAPSHKRSVLCNWSFNHSVVATKHGTRALKSWLKCTNRFSTDAETQHYSFCRNIRRASWVLTLQPKSSLSLYL